MRWWVQGTVLHGIVHQLLLLHDGLHSFPSQWSDLWVFWRCIKYKMKSRGGLTLQAASLMLSAHFFLLVNNIFKTKAAKYSHLNLCAKSAGFFQVFAHLVVTTQLCLELFACIQPMWVGAPAADSPLWGSRHLGDAVAAAGCLRGGTARSSSAGSAERSASDSPCRGWTSANENGPPTPETDLLGAWPEGWVGCHKKKIGRIVKIKMFDCEKTSTLVVKTYLAC